MKKYLTAAALLAAGTAFVNAATLTFNGGWDSFAAGSSVASALLDTDTTSVNSAFSGISFTGTSSALTVTNGSGAITIGTNDASSSVMNTILTDGTQYGGVMFVTTFSSITSTEQILSSFNVNGISVSFVLTPGQNGLSDATISAIYDNSSYSAGTKTQIATNVNLDTASGNVSLAYGFQRDLGYFVYVGGSLYNISNRFGGGIRQVTIGSYSTVTENVGLGNFTMENFYAYSLSASAVTSDQLSAVVSEALARSAIPEPSAFGLLAGAGAFALVAARRRRAK